MDIHKEHQKYLGFKWEFQENGRKITRYFIFTVMPFGLSPASYVFTKMLRPFAKHWRAMGMKVVIYLDDGIAAKKTKESAGKAAQIIIQTLSEAGFYINWEKSDFRPKQEGRWLGTNIDTTSLQFSVPKEKIQKLTYDINNIKQMRQCTAKQLASIAGHLSSMQPALGNIVRLFTRKIYAQIESRLSWHVVETISPGTTEELEFWSKNIGIFNGCSFKPRYSTSKMIFTDASDTGYGGFTVDKLGEHVCTGKFTPEEANTSSTHRELLAIKFVLQSYGQLLEGQAIQVNIDNQPATRILTNGSTKLHLHKIALDIFQYCIKHDIKLLPQ